MIAMAVQVRAFAVEPNAAVKASWNLPVNTCAGLV